MKVLSMISIDGLCEYRICQQSKDFERRISLLEKPSSNTLGNNWQYLLTGMGWDVSPVVEFCPDVELLWIGIEGEERVPLFIANTIVFPGKEDSTSEFVRDVIKKIDAPAGLLAGELAMFRVPGPQDVEQRRNDPTYWDINCDA
jgi:hypothetical protein